LSKKDKAHWTEAAADQVEQRVGVEQRGARPIVVASGISPSGAIHLGNLREVMTSHLVAEELRRRGWTVDYVHSWDDYDRLRKVPVGVPQSFAEHIGRPLCDVPDPEAGYASYADRHIAEFEASLALLGIAPRTVRQSRAYRRGDYADGIKRAMAQRFAIFDILAEYQNLQDESTAADRRQAYYPYKLYCTRCGKDTTRILEYDEATATGRVACDSCHHGEPFAVDDQPRGKLSWKVDWPMRWVFEGVTFEPGGEDHSSPGSSYTVGKKIVRDIYGGAAPCFIGYAFVGIAGRSKMSSSAGDTATPGAALAILEPCMLRWLYLRRNASQKFNIDFGKEVVRLYDEWDAFRARADQPDAPELVRHIALGSLATSAGPVGASARPVSFRLLSSAADITCGAVDQILRVVADHTDDAPAPAVLGASLEPRLSCAVRWATQYVPEDERTHIRDTFAADVHASLGEADRRGVALVVDGLDRDFTLAGLTRLVYGVPKVLGGLPMDAPPTEALKAAQRSFFSALYRLLLASGDTGPRLPTLFLSLGVERVRALLSPRG
jgi:lysyl-tRNA synthetase class 1